MVKSDAVGRLVHHDVTACLQIPAHVHRLGAARALEQTARDILAHSDMTPVVLCATDSCLERRLERIPGVVALGWRTDVRALMATSACVVQNAGGFTSLEALASGTPVITYRSISGHGAANSANLDRAGLIP
ncbi:glycosyltransferase [Nocardioides albus]|uniref:UDP-N-acetylglucosamine:LPS N-acetylglucosamine transferase n=1 Tax=Nocardioides albus TaxID=1841 RepID=A0A7W5A383_9ACTN|nr:glycosyltransferase [Nocardioides albus]MBB3088580.1 UDP-N-acetylglucosamine:LPS N-acetylglucosamine transferase [Nocardioides albus]GGU17286.1 hypothetical protein GCM10007979_14710 [Nocardioides albus]